MERRGFHGYQKPQSSSSGLKLSDINMKLAEVNHNKMNATCTNNGNNNNNNNGTSGASDENECSVREQDRFMPIANVIRIMRKILPLHAKISDDAKETIQECVSEYISFITGEANSHCQHEQRKTITAEDVLWAMSKLVFDDYIEPLTVYLHRFREMECDRGGSMRTETLIKTTSAGTRAMAAAEYHAAVAAAAAGSLEFAPFHHHGFFRYLKDASAMATTNGDGAGTPSSQLQAHFANATPVANGDHQAI